MRSTDPISLIGDRPRARSVSSAADLYPGNHGNNRPLHCQPWKRSIWPCPTQFVSLLSKMYYLTELGILLIQPTIAFTDNQAAIALADGEGDYRRAKHIDIRYHFIRDHLQCGTVEINYIPSEKQPADFLMKALPFAKHNASITT